jgi:hypothetical protein
VTSVLHENTPLVATSNVKTWNISIARWTCINIWVSCLDDKINISLITNFVLCRSLLSIYTMYNVCDVLYTLGGVRTGLSQHSTEPHRFLVIFLLSFCWSSPYHAPSSTSYWLTWTSGSVKVWYSNEHRGQLDPYTCFVFTSCRVQISRTDTYWLSWLSFGDFLETLNETYLKLRLEWSPMYPA